MYVGIVSIGFDIDIDIDSVFCSKKNSLTHSTFLSRKFQVNATVSEPTHDAEAEFETSKKMLKRKVMSQKNYLRVIQCKGK
jgi:hypothetical protein